MKSPARGGLTSAPQFLIFNDGCVELSWKWGVPKQYLKWEVVPDQPVEAEKPRLITFNYFYAWVWKIEFISEENPMKSHNGLHVHNNGANIAIPLGSKTESLHSTSERGTLCGNLVSLAHQWPGCQKVQG